jgi:hypothetical protein
MDRHLVGDHVRDRCTVNERQGRKRTPDTGIFNDERAFCRCQSQRETRPLVVAFGSAICP